MSRIERNDTKTSNSGKKIKSFWQNGKKEPFFAHPLDIKQKQILIFSDCNGQ